MTTIKVSKSYVWLPVLLLSALSTVAGCARLRPIPEGVDPVTVKGEIVQANTFLFRPGIQGNDPAKIVFSLDSETSREDLEKVARMAFSLKGTRPGDPDRLRIAREVTNEFYRPNRFVKLPSHLSPDRRTYMTDVWIERERLSSGYLRTDGALIFHVYLADGEPYTIRLAGDMNE